MDMKADGHHYRPLSPLRVNTDFKARWILNIRMRADQSPCPLIMVMWCNPPVAWWPISHVSLWPLLMLRLEITGEPVLCMAQCGALVSIVRPGPHTSPSHHPMSLDVSPAGPEHWTLCRGSHARLHSSSFFLHWLVIRGMAFLFCRSPWRKVSSMVADWFHYLII